jgi:murein DD-endopeptidase MepM/ murein hydrolase activator NlpD
LATQLQGQLHVRSVRFIGFGVAVAIAIGLLRDQIGLTYRVARFYMEPPDPFILMPVKGVARENVANTWDSPRPGGRKHQGQDIFARKGTPVLSATDGVVVRIGGGKLGGNAVFVTGRGVRTYYYAHLSEYAPGLEVGQLVSRGDLLGFVGNTGNASTTAPHLHFGVYTARGAIDPLPLIERQTGS